ncbi:MAG: type II toxin-antitoxin system Phd/YefM family antitoxin [Chloroflexi bacterium]|nr:type II toxin-antitoxin system Phd/YefM family antitoxin [Chloroflexota bacterium]
MEKTIGAFEIRRNFGKILQEVTAKGDSFIVERHGEPVAAVVPIEVYEQWKQARSAFFDKIRAASERANLSAEEAETLAAEAVEAIRSGQTS